jgi:hypothetical protein
LNPGSGRPFRGLARSWLVASIFLTACTVTGPITPICRSGEVAAISDTLYFGTHTPGNPVTASEWNEFLAASGYRGGATHWIASGAWTSRQGLRIQEAVHVLQIVHREHQPMEHQIARLIAGYRARFRQESVLRVRTPACVSGIEPD